MNIGSTCDINNYSLKKLPKKVFSLIIEVYAFNEGNMGKLFELKNADTHLKITNKTETSAEIIIYSEIGETFWGDGVSAKSFSDELKKLPDSVKEITVRVNSPGGDVFDGVTIYNRLKQHSANVTVYIDGLAASIASIVALAGNEVIASEGTLMMIHKPMAGIHGNANEMEEMITLLDEVEEQLVSIYRRKTNMDRSEIKALLSKETWMNAEEAKEMGFVDSIMAEDEEIKMAACSKDYSKIPWMKGKNIDNGRDAYIKKQITKFKQDAEALLTR